MVSINEIHKGSVIMFNDAPHLVVEHQHVNPGKGSAFVRTRLKHLMTGKSVEHTYKSIENVTEAQVARQTVQYLYHDDANAYFMDLQSYEQFQLSLEATPGLVEYVVDGANVIAVILDDKPLTIELPRKVELKVIAADPAVRGDTAGGNVTKEITVETGAKFRAPMFIKAGDVIRINTDTREYVERAN